MNAEKLGQESAFPTDYVDSKNGGMSKRFYAACMAMQGLLANPQTGNQIVNQFGSVRIAQANQLVCTTAYRLADELLKQEEL